MADHDGDDVDETLEELGVNYQRLNPIDEDDNDEGTVEYLDLDMEVEVVPDSIEYLSELTEPIEYTPQILSSVLKTRSNNTNLIKQESKYKSARVKQILAAAEPCMTRSRSSAKKAINSKTSKQSTKKKSKASVPNDVIANNAKEAKRVNGHGQTKPNTKISEAIENLQNEDNILNNNSQAKCGDDSIDLFFQSMAQTVLSLPLQIQAKIKMDICTLITMAEINYCTSDTVEDSNKANT